MFKLDLEKAEEPEIKLPTFIGSLKKRESLKNIYFCFIDYAKAFDDVDHSKLWKILKEMGIPDHLTYLLRNLYADQEATVRTGHETTDWFKIQFSSVQSLSHVRLFATPWTTAHQASLSITNSRSLLKLMSIESVMPCNHLILCCPLFLLPSIFPSMKVFSNESALCIRWPMYWSFSFNINPPNEHQDWFPLGWNGWISLPSKRLPRVFSSTTVQKHQFFSAQLSL